MDPSANDVPIECTIPAADKPVLASAAIGHTANAAAVVQTIDQTTDRDLDRAAASRSTNRAHYCRQGCCAAGNPRRSGAMTKQCHAAFRNPALAAEQLPAPPRNAEAGPWSMPAAAKCTGVCHSPSKKQWSVLEQHNSSTHTVPATEPSNQSIHQYTNNSVTYNARHGPKWYSFKSSKSRSVKS